MLRAKVIKFSTFYEVDVFFKHKVYTYIVEVDKNNNILRIEIDHTYMLKRSTRKALVQKIHNYFNTKV